MRIVDLRSDTVTQPTPEMREAMYRAEVGDDGYRDDPTVNRLEALAAERLGTEAALLVLSGTMGNLVAMLTHCGRGREVIMGSDSHIFWNETGGAAGLGGLHPRTVLNQADGTMALADIEAAVRPDPNNVHFPRTGLICLENTHNRCSGRVLSAAYTRDVVALGQRHGVAVHLDGARIFNAAVAQGCDVRDLTSRAGVASVQFCLTKGLSAPMGSMICGTRAFVEEARHWRQAAGGGMRQAGVVAAAGIVALDTMVDRLVDDHDNAKLLAKGLAQIPGIGLDAGQIDSNIVIFRMADPNIASTDVLRRLGEAGVRGGNYWGGNIRMVTHYGVERDDIEYALSVIRSVMAGPE
jgi:threonine aldolase